MEWLQSDTLVLRVSDILTHYKYEYASQLLHMNEIEN